MSVALLQSRSCQDARFTCGFAIDADEKSELLGAAQYELMKHHWDVFCTEPLSIAEGGKGVIVPRCVACRKLLYTNNQYLSHFALDVVSGILERFTGAWRREPCPPS
jgi:hypothetical protein